MMTIELCRPAWLLIVITSFVYILYVDIPDKTFFAIITLTFVRECYVTYIQHVSECDPFSPAPPRKHGNGDEKREPGRKESGREEKYFISLSFFFFCRSDCVFSSVCNTFLAQL